MIEDLKAQGKIAYEIGGEDSNVSADAIVKHLAPELRERRCRDDYVEWRIWWDSSEVIEFVARRIVQIFCLKG